MRKVEIYIFFFLEMSLCGGSHYQICINYLVARCPYHYVSAFSARAQNDFMAEKIVWICTELFFLGTKPSMQEAPKNIRENMQNAGFLTRLRNG